MKIRTAFAFTLIFLSIYLAGVTFGADWNQWRGANRNDIIDESSGYKDSWSPKRLWGNNVGKGCTSPIIVNKRLYVMGWQGEGDVYQNPVGTDTLYCFDAITGEEIWKQSYTCRYHNRVRAGDETQYGGPSSTPSFDLDTEYIYTFSIDADLRCWDSKQNGKLIWAKNLNDEYTITQRPNLGGGIRDFGFASSPLIYDGLIIVEVGAKEGTVIAFDKMTGEQRWISACKEPAGHTSSPVMANIQGVRCLVNLTAQKLVIMRIDDGHEGETVGEYDWQTDYANNIATPAISENKIIVTSAHNKSRSSMLEATLEEIKEVWTVREFSQISSPVIYEDNVYMASGNFKCLDLNSGKPKWKGSNFDNGSCFVTAGDNKVIAFGKGNLVLIDAFPSDNQYHELGRIENIVPGTCYPHVTLSDGIICCKDMDGNMVCFSLLEN